MRSARLLPIGLALVAAGCSNPIHLAFPTLLDGVNPPYVTTAPCDGQDPGTTPSLPWAVGSRVPVTALTGGVVGSTVPSGLRVSSSAPGVFAIESGPDAQGVVVLRATSPGAATIHVTADGADPADVTLHAAAPGALRLFWADPESKPDYRLDRPPLDQVVMGTADATGTSFAAYLVDAAGAPLCAAPPDAVVGATGVTLSDGAQLNSGFGIYTGASAGPASLDVTLGAFRGTVPIDVVADGAITAFHVTPLDLYPSGGYLLLAAEAGPDEVYGAHLLVEDLSPAVIQLEDAVSGAPATSALLPTGIDLISFPVGTPAGATGQLRISAPGTALAPTTITLTVPAS